MAQVTYYVALPCVATDDGVAAGEPTECFNPVAVVRRRRRVVVVPRPYVRRGYGYHRGYRRY
jgi:hypothetical protein